MKKRIIALFMITTVTLFTACANNTNSENSLEVEEKAEENQTETSEEVSEGEEKVETSATDEASFEYLSKFSYEFCSGAGGWSTDFEIERNGYFHGNYHDSDMGDSGDDYPDGTMYSSVFTGYFKDLTKIDDYTYEMTLVSISYKDEVGTEEISDGIKYVYSEAYGLTGTEKFLVYMPGKDTGEIDEEVYSWLEMWLDNEGSITSPVLVNEDEKEGIYSYERQAASDEAESLYNSYKTSYDYYMNKVSEASTTLEMEDNESGAYKAADDCLNELWTLVKYNNDEDTYNTILEEQRAWLKDLDAGAEEAMSAADGGSLAEVDKIDYLATTTMDRCNELLDYIK